MTNTHTKHEIKSESESGKVPFSREATSWAKVAYELGYIDYSSMLDLLYRNLHYHDYHTTNLEAKIVCPSIHVMLVGHLFPTQDALNRALCHTYVEEAEHLKTAMSTSWQVCRACDVEIDFNAPQSSFFQAQSVLIANAPAEISNIAEFIVPIATETLISGTLENCSNDSLLSIVRDTLTEHAEDERKHARIYSQVFKELIVGQSEKQFVSTCILLAQLVYAFLKPDLKAVRYALLQQGLSHKSIEEVIECSFPRSVIEKSIKKGAAPTVLLLRSVGAVDVNEIEDEMHKIGLI